MVHQSLQSLGLKPQNRPAQVVQKQSANVNAISGATASSQAFKQAIQQALAQATAANSTTGSASS